MNVFCVLRCYGIVGIGEFRSEECDAYTLMQFGDKAPKLGSAHFAGMRI